MNPVRTLLNLLIIAVGPFATISYILATYGSMSAAIFHIFIVLILSVVTAAISTAVHLKLKHPLFATFASVVISYIGYILLALAVIFFSSNAQDLALEFTWFWFPIAISFWIPRALPLACSVSYGTGRIVRDYMEASSSRRKLPLVFVDDLQQHRP